MEARDERTALMNEVLQGVRLWAGASCADRNSTETAADHLLARSGQHDQVHGLGALV
jgi:hypothetical protein